MIFNALDTRVPSIKWCHFQWPWVTPNRDFKVKGYTIDALDVLCAQLTRDLFAIAKFLVNFLEAVVRLPWLIKCIGDDTKAAICQSQKCFKKTKQELSYRKQIERKLHTQYVEGIYNNLLTLKFRLTVTQGHWKRNHWVGHTRLTFSRVIGRWILSCPWNMGQRSLKVIEISAIRKLGCGFLFAFYKRSV